MAQGGAKPTPDFATPSVVLGTAAAAGSSASTIRSDSTIVAFDATVPVTQVFGDAAATGSAAFAAHRDHRHGMPTVFAVNALPNGDLTEWQRGTSFAAVANGAMTADKWSLVQVGTAALTIARDTSVPPVGANAINTPYSLTVTIPTTADASIAAGDLYALYTDVEGYDYRALTNGMALSFWAKAHRTGTYCVRFGNRGGDRSYIAEYTINAGDTWEYKTVVISTPPTAGTWGYDTTMGVRLGFALAAGSTFQTTASAWQTGNFYGTSNQVNGVGLTTDTFSLALVNLIPGSAPQPLVAMPYAQHFARSQRYAQMLASNANDPVGLGLCTSTTNARIFRNLPVEMGGTPSITITAPGNFWLYNAAGGVVAPSAISTLVLTSRGLMLDCTTSASLTAGNSTGLFVAANGSIFIEWNPG